jgi:hypothetical protein
LTVSPFWAYAFKDKMLVSATASQVFFDASQVS